MSTKLAESYRWCWKVVRSSGSSFYRSFFLLKQPARDSIAALYAFARITDDLGDAVSIGTRDEEQRIKSNLLDAWLIRLQAALAEAGEITVATDYEVGGNGDMVRSQLQQYESLWPALIDTVSKYGIPLRLLEDIVRGVVMDLSTVRMANWDELCDYCYHVAAAVGLACAHVWNASEKLPPGVAIDCGIAFQLTNIMRDVREDAASDRIYVPKSLLTQFACSEEAWLRGEPDGNWQGCIDSLCKTAKIYYDRGWQTHEFLGADGRKMFSLMWRTYRQLLDEIQRNKSILWSWDKVQLPRSVRWHLAASHFVASWYRQLPDPLFAPVSKQ